jgi:hypothetical protein
MERAGLQVGNEIVIKNSNDLPPFDSRALYFDISHETRRTIVDLIRGSQPTTVLGVLLAHTDDGVTVEVLAKQLKRPVGQISWYVEKLETENLCVRSKMEGHIKVLPLAAYTERNE